MRNLFSLVFCTCYQSTSKQVETEGEGNDSSLDGEK